MSQEIYEIPEFPGASRTVGCAFFTSGGKRPAIAAAMPMATGGNLIPRVATGQGMGKSMGNHGCLWWLIILTTKSCTSSSRSVAVSERSPKTVKGRNSLCCCHHHLKCHETLQKKGTARSVGRHSGTGAEQVRFSRESRGIIEVNLYKNNGIIWICLNYSGTTIVR